MSSDKLTTLQQIGLTLVVGILLAAIGLMMGKPEIDSRIRELVPDELKVETMILVDYDEVQGAALFEVVGQIPESMRSFELINPRHRIRAVPWKSTPTKINKLVRNQNCSCFACATDPQICMTAVKWLKNEGSLFYLSSSSTGTSYILNRDNRQLIIVWNRAL